LLFVKTSPGNFIKEERMNYYARHVFKLILILFFVNGCQKVYYNTMEKLGTHKRDILASRIENARDSQKQAKEQFNSALEQFIVVLNVKGGELEEKYNKINAVYEKSVSRAEDVQHRIEQVEDVAEALFDEWKAELDEYTNSQLRRNSEKKLAATQKKYAKVIGAMKRAEKKIHPVLAAFKNQVLTLKHNLNATVIASLQSELVTVETDVKSLIREMEGAIAEANSFLASMDNDAADKKAGLCGDVCQEIGDKITG